MRSTKMFVMFLVAGGLLASPRLARAADFYHGPNEFSFHVGGQGGWWDWTPGGAKLFFEYGRWLKDQEWLDLQANFVFGDRWGNDDCHWDGHHWVCHHWGYSGFEAELVGGVKWKFVHVIPPFVPYAKVGGLVGLVSYPNLYGFAIGVRGGGGFKYFFLKNFGAGMEINMAMGFNMINHDVGFHFFWAIDVGFGIEVLF